MVSPFRVVSRNKHIARLADTVPNIPSPYEYEWNPHIDTADIQSHKGYEHNLDTFASLLNSYKNKNNNNNNSNKKNNNNNIWHYHVVWFRIKYVRFSLNKEHCRNSGPITTPSGSQNQAQMHQFEVSAFGAIYGLHPAYYIYLHEIFVK